MEKEFRNNASPADKIAQLHNDRLRAGDHAPTTRHQMANQGVDLDLNGGQAPGGYVMGSEPSAHWPALPPGSPWGNGPQPGQEPPFPLDISYVEPVGSMQEIDRAQEILRARELACEGSATDAMLARSSHDVSTSQAIPAPEGFSSPVGPSVRSSSALAPLVQDRESSLVSPSSNDELGAAIHSRLKELLDRGLVRRAVPQVRRRKL
jgi:hypothetical protein